MSSGYDDRHPARVAVIINPRSGVRPGRRSAEDRRALATRLFREHDVHATVLLTERVAHAGGLARQAVADGAEWVFAWGGDGTVNEIASALAFGPSTLAIIPSGSGNGLARELGIPRDPVRAIHTAFTGEDKVIDAGDIDGRLFFNMAGLGFDAHVAHHFGTAALGRRGLASYVWTTGREALRYRPSRMVLETADERIEVRPFLVALANGREWGNGARVAPRARPDDGRLELVVVSSRWPPAALARSWRLFTNSFDRASCTTSRAVQDLSIESDSPVAIHIDGEPIGAHTSMKVRVRPGALRVRVPGGQDAGARATRP